MCHRLALALLLGTAAAAAAPAPATPSEPAGLVVGKDRRVQVHHLQSVELRGTSRMTTTQLVQELGLSKGMPLNDDFVMTTRTQLLGLGIFKSAILIMRKGSKPGMARLIIEVEDDDGVLSDWALGGDLAATLNDSSVPNADPNTAPMDYRLGLIGRNVFKDRHRASLLIDIDSKGLLRQGQLAYGLPRFTREDSQFDAQLAVVSPNYRYLDALGFGGRGEGLWSYTVAGQSELQYGAAMYVNRKPEFTARGFPDAVAGPKIALYRETRLHGFFTGAGELMGASALVSPIDPGTSVVEVNLARSWSFGNLLYTTIDAKGLGVGSSGYAYRGELRGDLALGRALAGEDQAALFVRLRGGQDRTHDAKLTGSEVILGLRYHSSGFIAELAVRITHAPQRLAPKPGTAPGLGWGEP